MPQENVTLDVGEEKEILQKDILTKSKMESERTLGFGRVVQERELEAKCEQ